MTGGEGEEEVGNSLGLTFAKHNNEMFIKWQRIFFITGVDHVQLLSLLFKQRY